MQALDMAGHLIRRLHQHSTQVYAAHTREAGFDITSVQFAALDAIRVNPGIDQAGVAALIAYDRPTIGEVINRLVTKGLVERAISDTDRRARVLRLTPEGEAAFERLLPIVRNLQEAILGNLTRDERTDFLALVKAAIRER
ncbi:MarR family transcriptional regulator [Novosphingobium sp.]|uniref:MarR family winged helix-turn-helix transcriptional regulator n=1 Tax=Novosphingobium sp. TaxID=1874826 RepID=UPI00260BF66E|nr:MarR family transcriptional regulator [Novosphingobium sp.]